MSISIAKMHIRNARTNLESRRFDDIASELDQAERLLVELSEEQAADTLTEIVTLRYEADKAIAVEEAERIVRRARGALMRAESELDSGYASDIVEETIRDAEKLLAGVADVHKAEAVSAIAALRARLGVSAPAPIQLGGSGAPSDVVSAASPELSGAAANMVRAAKLHLRRIDSQLEQGYPLDAIEETIRGAEKYVDDVAAPDKAEVIAEIAALRERLGASAPASTPSHTPALQAVAPGPSDHDRVNLSQAKSQINYAASLVERPNFDEYEQAKAGQALKEAADFLITVDDDQRLPLLGQIRKIRADILCVVAAEKRRRIESELDRHLRAAEKIDYGFSARHTGEALTLVARRLTDDDVQRFLPAETIGQVRTRLAASEVNRMDAIKARALEGALPVLQDLEERVANDPFGGELDEYAAYRVMSDLQDLKYRVYNRLWSVAEDWSAATAADDPDIVAIDARISAVNKKIDNASAACAQAVRKAKIQSLLREAKNRSAGWHDETFAYASSYPFGTPHIQLHHTYTAAADPRLLLEDPEIKKIFDDNVDDPQIMRTFRELDEDHETALAKVAATYHSILDELEKLPTPMRFEDRLRPEGFVASAEKDFHETAHFDSVVSRARALDERFKAEYIAIIAAQQDLWDRLVTEGNATWPAIVTSTGACVDVDPTTSDAHGRTVLLQDVYNRSGWEYAGFDFATQWQGVPIGGDYDPHVLEALEHAWYQMKFTNAVSADVPAVNDRISWDVIAVVVGPGKIKERTTVEKAEVSTGRTWGEEQWPAVDCIQLRIIGLHAGPVAVGPQHHWAPTN
ncbi:hypothetical protein ABT272_41265 [Streptomyces sp900105245]|uniref:Uncharacterized protein n=1 Tax=Streptomyces sp. 900105245 TaxID=3154379 RepID=A0ABV1UK16_9ACTN